MKNMIFILASMLLSVLCNGEISLNNLNLQRLFPSKQGVELLSHELFKWQKDMKDVYSERHFNILGDFNKDGIKDLAILCKYQPKMDSTDYFLAIISYKDVLNPKVEFVKYLYYKENLANKNIADHIFKATSNFDLDKLQLDFMERVEFPEKLTGLAINPQGTLLTCFFGKRDGIDIQWIINKYTAEEWFDAPDADTQIVFSLTQKLEEDIALIYLVKDRKTKEVKWIGYNSDKTKKTPCFYFKPGDYHKNNGTVLYPPDLSLDWDGNYSKYRFIYLFTLKANAHIDALAKKYCDKPIANKSIKNLYDEIGKDNIINHIQMIKHIMFWKYNYIIKHPEK